MKIDLLDVNIWVALTFEQHPHHVRAKDYWANESADSIAVCRISMMGYLRIVTAPTFTNGVGLTTEQAWTEYEGFRGLAEVILLPEPASFEANLARLTRYPGLPRRLWTDACLAAWAIGHDARLVSFDADFGQFAGLNFLHLTAA